MRPRRHCRRNRPPAFRSSRTSRRRVRLQMRRGRRRGNLSRHGWGRFRLRAVAWFNRDVPAALRQATARPALSWNSDFAIQARMSFAPGAMLSPNLKCVWLPYEQRQFRTWFLALRRFFGPQFLRRTSSAIWRPARASRQARCFIMSLCRVRGKHHIENLGYVFDANILRIIGKTLRSGSCHRA